MKAEDPEVCSYAIKKLSPEIWHKTLKKIATNSKYENVRVKAYSQLGDNKALEEIAKNDTDEKVRLAALLELNYEERALVKIFNESKNIAVRYNCIKNLSEGRWQNFFENIAFKERENKIVRFAAIEQLNPIKWEKFLASIALGEDSEFIGDGYSKYSNGPYRYSEFQHYRRLRH